MIILMTQKLPERRGELRTIKTHGGMSIVHVDRRGEEHWNLSHDEIRKLQATVKKSKV